MVRAGYTVDTGLKSADRDPSSVPDPLHVSKFHCNVENIARLKPYLPYEGITVLIRDQITGKTQTVKRQSILMFFSLQILPSIICTLGWDRLYQSSTIPTSDGD